MEWNVNRLPRRQLAIIAFYLVLAVLITWPLVTVMSTELVGDSTSDAYEMGRHIWWFKHALQTGQPLFFQPLLGYPDGMSGISLWADPLQFFPAWLFAFVMPIPAAYNLTVLLTMALNGWAMYWLVTYLLDEYAERKAPAAESTASGYLSWVSLPALIAGAVFMAFPTMQGHLLGGHAGLLVMWPVPFYVYALFRLLETPRRRWLILAVVFFILSPTGHALQLMYVLLPINGVLFLTLLANRAWGKLGRLLLVSLLGGFGLLIFLLPVITETVDTPAYFDPIGNVRYSADLLGIVSPSFQHPFFGQLDYPRQVLGINLVEGSTYLGIIVSLLAVFGLFRRSSSRWWLLLAVVAWILSLGSLLKIFDQPVTIQTGSYESYITLPLIFVEDWPFFSLGRSPGRFTFVLALAMAVLAGYGASTLVPHGMFRKRRGHWLVAGLLLAGIIWEYQFFWPVPRVSGEIPAEITALADRDDVRAVFNIPWENPLAIKDGLYLQTGHEKPLIGGQVTRQTPVNPAKLALLSQLDPVLLQEAEADIVILHKQRAQEMGVKDELSQRADKQLGTPLYENDRIAVYEVPAVTTDPDFTVLADSASTVSDQAETYLYTAEPGWIDFTARLAAKDRDISLYLDGERMHSWSIDNMVEVHVPLPVAASGYHTVTLALEPPCPVNYNEALSCRTLWLDGIELEPLTSGVLYDPIPLEHGVELAGSYLPMTAQAGQTLPVHLWWQFAEALSPTDVRFVHVLDRNQNLITQIDSPMAGNREAGTTWAEQLDITLPADLAPGMYTVYTGWYTYPDATRFDVLTDVQGAQNGLVYIGQFRLN